MRRYSIENRFWETGGKKPASSKGQFDKQIRELIPYITSGYECSIAEAELMAGVVFTAMVRKMFATGIVKTPLGRMVFSVSPKLKYPLRVKMYVNYQTTLFINTGTCALPIAVQECMLPEDYNLLVNLREKAIDYKKEKNAEHDEV